MMNQKFPSFFSCKNEKYYLYYQFPRNYLAFFCFSVHSDLEMIFSVIREKLPEFKISFIVNLKSSECFVFLSIKVVEKEILSHIVKKIQNILTEISPNSPLQLLRHDLLLSVFFYFLNGRHQELSLQLNPKERFICLTDGNNKSKLFFHNLRITLPLDITKPLTDLMYFTQTNNIEAFLILEVKTWKKFRISMLIISESESLFKNFENFIENLNYNKIFRKSSIFLNDFINLTKKKSLKSSLNLNLNKFIKCCSQINPLLKIHGGNIPLFTFSPGNKSLEAQIRTLLDREKLSYNKVAKNVIFVTAKESLIFVQNSDNLEELFNFLQKYYKITNHLFLIIHKKYILNKLQNTTEILKLKKFRVISSQDLHLLTTQLNKIPNHQKLIMVNSPFPKGGGLIS